MTRRFSPQLGLWLVVLFWAGNFTAAKIALGELDPLAFTAIRFVLGSVVLWIIVRAVEGRVRLPQGAFWPLLWMGVIGNTIYQVCFIEGLQRTSASKAAMILAGMPVLVTVAAALLGIEKVTGRQQIAVLIATIGVVIVVLGRGGSIGGGIGTGELLLLGSVVTWAVFTLMLRRQHIELSALNLTAWTMYTGTPGLVLVAIPALLHTDWHRVTIAGWSGIIYSALLSLVAAYVLWNYGVATLGAARTVVYNTVVPLFATLIAMVMLHERPGLVHVVGGVLIVMGVLLTAGGGQVDARSPEPSDVRCET